MSTLDELKATLTVWDVAEMLGLDVPQGSTPCFSPWRDERTASLSIHENGTRWKDFGSEDGGDIFDLISKAMHVDLSDATKWLIERTGGSASSYSMPSLTRRPRPPEKAKEPLVLPKMERPTISELHQLQELRGLEHFAGLQMLCDRGQLGFCDLWDGHEQVRCWVVFDDSRRNAQARRLDGAPWKSIDAKAKTLRGSEAAWPIGASRIHESDTVFFCEGAPDLLSAATFATFDFQGDWEAVAMIGAGLHIHPEALPIFKGKTVFLFVHNDSAGIAAARRWSQQLTEAGATVTALRSDTEGRDLNDVLIAEEPISFN
jgi:hypothetical protein